MFKTGLEYVRADFHLHTHKDKEFKYDGEDNDFVKKYVMHLKQANIGIGVITNHNKFDKCEYKAICKAAKKEDIFILPGVELTIKEGANGVHTLIVFNPDEWLANGDNHIQTFLTTAFATISNPENRNVQCTLDIGNTLKTLDSYGRDYFIIFAHVDQGSGLFNECQGGLLKNLSEIANFKNRVLGLQKSRTYDNQKKFKEYFKYIPALVEGSDPKKLSDIGKGDRQTFLKIGEYSYSAIKFALQDYQNRVTSSYPEINHGYIESLYFQGGKFDGQQILLSSELNTLIGIRGSGKSSVLEIIRYLFNIPIQSDQDYKDSLITNILESGGKVTASIIDRYKKRYFVSRILNEDPTITNEEKEILNISPLSLLDYNIQYFGQKDLSTSSDHENSFIERFTHTQSLNESPIKNCVSGLCQSTLKLINMGKIPTQIEEFTTQKNEQELKKSIYEEKGIDKKLKKQTSFNTDETKLKTIHKTCKTIHQQFSKIYNAQNTLTNTVIDKYISNYNIDLFNQAKIILKSIKGQLNKIEKCINDINNECQKFDSIEKILNDRIKSLKDEFAEIKREIKDDNLDADTYTTIVKKLEEINDCLADLQNQSNQKENIKACFIKAVEERNMSLKSKFDSFKTEADKINSSQSELKIEITFKGDRDQFKSELKNDFKGTGINDNKYQKIVDNFSDYVDLIYDWIINDNEKLQKILTQGELTMFNSKLKNQYSDLLTRQVNNKVQIYYHNKLLKYHSIGQRASALILFILTQTNNEIILIDQPEDDLDNKTIYNEVIHAIIEKKKNTQFIFATHNANIPVLGDAERVLTVDYQDSRINIDEGNIDLNKTHRQIVDIMEGGQEAFDKRKLIYTNWR